MDKDNSLHTLLIVEDNEINREILGEILGGKYHLVFAENGKVGLDIMHDQVDSIDLVLLDIQMPVMDGYEVLKAVQKDPLLSEIPIIVTTSHNSNSDEELCLKLGASDFVSKPYNPTIVQLRVESVIHLKESTRSNLQKTTFLQNISHEIRTPLNAILGFAQLLSFPDGSWSEEEKQEFASYIETNYKMMEMLLNDIFSMSDFSRDGCEIKKSDISVNQTCRNAMKVTEFRVPSGVKMYFTTELPDDYHIVSDGQRIQQVLVNYLTNACKHTTEGEIHLHCSNTEYPGKLSFSVTDTGTGIPADKAEAVFGRFTKLDANVPGSGLGLSICKVVAAKLDGEVFLDTSYTGGARFIFTLNV